ncbi:alanyl-tRNA editing protein [Eubacterium sp. F2]|jgi:alanyl-tRNA synthetase|uniref:alanyl-tRNA editing protein n=1 Tax=Eubacterium sp. F2 TaxID=3381348 RepID=UPI003907F607
MMTERLYQKNVYQKTCTAQLLEIAEGRQGSALILDQTVFCPEGGGQGSDRGRAVTKNGKTLEITDVQEEDGRLLHYFKAESGAELKEGDSLALQLDWDLRFDHMQRHAGEHILSGALHRLFGAFNQGFHMGEDCMTIDAAFRPEGEVTRMAELDSFPDYSKVSWEMALEAEREANRVVWLDAPIQVSYFKNREEAEAMPLRKMLNFDEDISVVTVGDPAHPLDCCPCCGTHPDSSGQVGLIKVYKVEQNRGRTRIYFDAGKRALENYQRQYDVLTQAGERLSAGEQDLLEKLDRLMQKEDELHNEVYQLRQARVNAAAEEIRQNLHPGLMKELNDLSNDEILRVQKKLRKAVSGVIFLVKPAEQAVFLLSDGKGTKNDCAAMVNELARPLGGKGGGKPQSARVRFDNCETMEKFLRSAAEFAELDK